LRADPDHLAHACGELWDVLEDFKGSYEWKKLIWKLNLRRGHQQYLKVGFAIDMRAEILQPFFFHIYTDHLVKAWSDKFGNETVPTPHVQVSLAFQIAGNRVDPAEREARKFLGSSRSMARCRPTQNRSVLNIHSRGNLLI